MDEVAAAIADPIRRAILEMLRDGRLTAGEIAGRFDVSRPAISRHLRVLRESGLVRDELSGRRRYYELDAAPLGELAGWIARFGVAGVWEQRLDALATEVHRTKRDRVRGTPRADDQPRAGSAQSADSPANPTAPGVQGTRAKPAGPKHDSGRPATPRKNTA